MIRVAAPPERAPAAAKHVRLSDLPLAWLLFRIRRLGARLVTETRVVFTGARARRRFAGVLARRPALQRPDTASVVRARRRAESD